jgi:hypothetical protein
VDHLLDKHCNKVVQVQVQGELAVVAKTDDQCQSFARVNYHPECEAAINEQIKCVALNLLALPDRPN